MCVIGTGPRSEKGASLENVVMMGPTALSAEELATNREDPDIGIGKNAVFKKNALSIKTPESVTTSFSVPKTGPVLKPRASYSRLASFSFTEKTRSSRITQNLMIMNKILIYRRLSWQRSAAEYDGLTPRMKRPLEVLYVTDLRQFGVPHSSPISAAASGSALPGHPQGQLRNWKGKKAEVILSPPPEAFRAQFPMRSWTHKTGLVIDSLGELEKNAICSSRQARLS